MKIVSLNTASGSQGQILLDYILSLAEQTEIFCLQEIFSAAPGTPEVDHGSRMHFLKELQEILPNYFCFYSEKSRGFGMQGPLAWPVTLGTALFIRNNVKVLDCNSYSFFNVTDVPETNPVEGSVILQVATVQGSAGPLRIMNFHGMSRPGSKVDSEKRIVQSKMIVEHIVSETTPVVVCGDFNLLPETQSVAMLEKHVKNLIKDFSITSTRNEVSWAKFSTKQYFADYVFVSPNISVKSFEVPYNEVSDHLPMLLDINL